MNSKRVLVTGATGFVGRPLMSVLLRAGYTVRAVTRRKESFPHPVETAFVPDFKDHIDWQPILRGVDIIVHLAGLAHANISEIAHSEFDQVNWFVTQRLAEAARQAGVERFVYISSVRAQTGASAVEIVHEDNEARPTNQYGRSKLAGEQAVRASGVPFTIFRPVVIYGPNPKGHMRTAVKLARSSWPLPAFGNRRSLLAIDNLTSAIIFALENPTTAGETYLIADPMPMTLTEIFKMLRKIQGRPLFSVKVPSAVMRISLWICGRSDLWSRFNGDLVVDTSKLEAAGWRPATDTFGGLRQMMRAEDDKNI